MNLHRVQPEQIETTDFVSYSHVETPSADDYEFSRLELACDSYRLFRTAGFSRWESLRHFFKALKGST